MQISLRLAEETERSFCESLSRENMESYRAARDVQWDPDRFLASWNEFENLVIVCGDQLVGTVRLSQPGKKPLTGCALAVRRVKSRGECC